MAESDKPTMHVKVYAPFRTYFDDNAYSVSAENRTGPFDVLPHHKNFMSLLVPCTITVRTPKDNEFNLKVTRGVMHVKSDRVTVFLDV
jgi:F0F1-type ATP synthase epsilon subunit